NAERWTGEIFSLSPAILSGVDCIVDALFGAGLSREVDGVVGDIIDAAEEIPCIAVDVPSGIHGDTGEIAGKAFNAVETVTFFRPKPGHLLFPGRERCGVLSVVDIGIPEAVLDEINPQQWRNGPETWSRDYPWPEINDHKYSRGHAVVVGGAEMTGAARLAVQSAMRAGAGIVTAAVPTESAIVYRLSLPGAIIHPVRDTGAFIEIVEDERVAACLVGPGNGINVATRERTLAALRQKLPVVLDADAISVFEETRELLFDSIQSPCLMTPHEGEFSRLFDFTGNKVSRVREAAARSGSTILLKGGDTVIAAPDGKVAINVNAPPDLATAGAGDVLAGFAIGLLARGLDPFEAACMATWIHGEAARDFGPGLIAEDLPDA
ncbi:MAG: NAD(P)H-hydrate dehydratase, partial [Pseudomonadota bacterium]|nr:NAD(P)H-hydrate dehydratase [Pseudomonadota bacterium]